MYHRRLRRSLPLWPSPLNGLLHLALPNARSTSTEQQLVDEVEPIPQSPQPSPQPEQSDRAESPKWAPPLTFNDRDIKATDSVVAEKDHQLAFNLAKSVCLPKDMEHHLKQLNTEMKSIRSASKSMILVNSSVPFFLFEFSNFYFGLREISV